MWAMSKRIYLLIGSPGVGKTWITNQLKRRYTILEHDDYKNNYVDAIVEAVNTSDKQIIANTPFGVSELTKALTDEGIKVVPVYVIEPENVLKARYKAREGRDIPQGHLTRQKTYKQRADATKAIQGTAKEILEYLS